MTTFPADFQEIAPKFTRDQVCAFPTETLWAILRSTRSLSEQFANELTWAKEELRRRGFSIA